MIRLTPEAETQLDELLHHYERLGRIEAAENLLTALEQARDRITQAPAAGFPASRPYPELAARGLRWIKTGSYWIAYSTTTPPVIHGFFYDAADFPRPF